MRYLVCLFLLVGVVFGEEGKLYVDSSPSKAAVFLVKEEMNAPLGMTKCLVRVPVGDQKLLFKKAGYEDFVLALKVENRGIKRLDVVKLKPVQLKADVLSAEDGWWVFVDGKPVKDVFGKDAVTPCTVVYTPQTRSVSIAKEGYRDQTFQIKAGDDIEEVNFKEEPRKGMSVLSKKPNVSIGNNVIIKHNGKKDIVTISSNFVYLVDRNYIIKDIPKELIGLSFLRLSMNNRSSVELSVPKGTRLYSFIDPRGTSEYRETMLKSGWRKITELRVTDKAQGYFIVFGLVADSDVMLTFPELGHTGACIATANMILK